MRRAEVPTGTSATAPVSSAIVATAVSLVLRPALADFWTATPFSPSQGFNRMATPPVFNGVARGRPTRSRLIARPAQFGPSTAIVGPSRPAHRLPDEAGEATCSIRSRRTSNPPARRDARDPAVERPAARGATRSRRPSPSRSAYRRRTPSRSRATHAARRTSSRRSQPAPSVERASIPPGTSCPEKRYTPLARLGSPFASSPHWMKPLWCTTPDTRSDALEVYGPKQRPSPRGSSGLMPTSNGTRSIVRRDRRRRRRLRLRARPPAGGHCSALLTVMPGRLGSAAATSRSALRLARRGLSPPGPARRSRIAESEGSSRAPPRRRGGRRGRGAGARASPPPRCRPERDRRATRWVSTTEAARTRRRREARQTTPRPH